MNDIGITVTAIGTASGPPDRAVLTLGASAIRGEVATALAAVNDKIEKLISTMASYGIQGADIQTSDLWIQPEHNEERALAGFRVRNTVRITITAMDAVGEIIGAAAAVLGDLAEIHDITSKSPTRPPWRRKRGFERGPARMKRPGSSPSCPALVSARQWR
jgi:uncharacterized protein YggE